MSVLQKKENPPKILKELNVKDKYIKFTVKEEKENLLNFLHVKIIKKEMKFRTGYS